MPAISSAPTWGRRRSWWRAPRTARSTCSRTAAGIARPSICRELSGTTKEFVCPYHQWTYNLKGDLIGVPFRRGVAGKGGMPADFRSAEHGLRKLNVTTHRGVVFASYRGRHGAVRRLSRSRSPARVRGDVRRPQAEGARPLPPFAARQLEALSREPQGPLSRDAAAHVPGDVRPAGRRQPLADADGRERAARRDGVGEVGREGRVQRHQEGDARLQGGHDAARAAIHGLRRRSSTARGRSPCRRSGRT